MTYSRWAWVEVDLDAIARNIRTLAGLAPPETLVMAVVKADGYGHGAVPVAETVLRRGADRLGVATVEEALELRSAGIAAPIHLLSEPPPSAAPLVVQHRIVPALFTRPFADALGRAAEEAGRVADFHLKVDTGMGRVGIRAEEAPAFALALAAIPGIRQEGTFTHFATADVPGDWEFEAQLKRFRDMLLRMKTEAVDPGIVHAANSPATVLHPEAHFGMIRCGIALYGLHPALSTEGRIELIPAMTVKARVSHVKSIGMGEGVSYGFTYHASGPTTIATLPLGYADGVHRAASDKMEVLLGGRRCRQVGRVCMDQLMVEVPAGQNVAVGDEAVLVGAQGGERIRMEEFAAHASTIDYETACAFAMRMRRDYPQPIPG